MSEHNHSHSCGCKSHSHNHEHHHGCGCHTHSSHDNCCKKHKEVSIENISEVERHFLKHLLSYEFLPVARFIVKSSIEHDFENIALSPVFIVDIKDTMEEVKNFGKKLKKLEDLGLLTLDYDIPIENYQYSEYHNAEIFNYFKETVDSAKGKVGFLGDISIIECGSMAPTQKCVELLGN